jgi:hypothetical protein
MIDLMAAGRAIAAELAATSHNPQVIRSQSASLKQVTARLPANPHNPQQAKPEKIQPTVMANPLEGLALLPDDHRWLGSLLQALPITRQRELLTEYRKHWLEAYHKEVTGHKKSNRGRFAANTWISTSLQPSKT